MFCEWDERGRGEAGGEGRSLSTPHCAPPPTPYTHTSRLDHTRGHTHNSQPHLLHNSALTTHLTQIASTGL